MPSSLQDCKITIKSAYPDHSLTQNQVRFNVLRVLPRTGSTKVKQFSKF